VTIKDIKRDFFTLDSKIEFYLPTMTIHHEPIARETIEATRLRVASLMSSLFGGCTATNAVGFYENKALGTTQVESVEILYSYAKTLGSAEVSEVIKLAHHVRDTLQQEAIMIVINGTAVFI
jgi:hypothetical protein